MRTARAVVATLLAATVAATTACEAPLEPESRRSSARPTAATPGTPSPTTPEAPGRASASTPLPSAPAVPSISVPSFSLPPLQGGIVEGADASWPQCPKGMGIPQKRSQGSPMPLATARFVILGLTNGPGYTPNPCLADQVEWVRSRRLLGAAYAVISQPDAAALRRYGGSGPFDGSTRLGALGNAGYQQAVYSVATMKRAGLRTPMVWLDVEPVPEFDWGPDTGANAAVVRGAARGYTDAGYRIGVYSTQSLWARVVGDLRLGLPEWRAAGQTSRAEALRRCGPDRMFQGGQPVLSQWVELGRDRNITCPGTASQLLRWFHQY